MDSPFEGTEIYPFSLPFLGTGLSSSNVFSRSRAASSFIGKLLSGDLDFGAISSGIRFDSSSASLILAIGYYGLDEPEAIDSFLTNLSDKNPEVLPSSDLFRLRHNLKVYRSRSANSPE